jgi:hypothetical protein
MDPNQPGSSNHDQGQAGSQQQNQNQPQQSGQQPNQAGQPTGARGGAQQQAAPKAQSEKGPTTYLEGGQVIQHGEGDAVTKDAYKLGHPADGIANQKAKNPPPQTQLQAGKGGQAGQPQQSGQEGAQAGQTGQQGQPGGGQQNAWQPGQTGQQGGTQRVQMLRDEGGHGAGQTVDLPSDQAQRLIDTGAARAV